MKMREIVLDDIWFNLESKYRRRKGRFFRLGKIWIEGEYC